MTFVSTDHRSHSELSTDLTSASVSIVSQPVPQFAKAAGPSIFELLFADQLAPSKSIPASDRSKSSGQSDLSVSNNEFQTPAMVSHPLENNSAGNIARTSLLLKPIVLKSESIALQGPAKNRPASIHGDSPASTMDSASELMQRPKGAAAVQSNLEAGVLFSKSPDSDKNRTADFESSAVATIDSSLVTSRNATRSAVPMMANLQASSNSKKSAYPTIDKGVVALSVEANSSRATVNQRLPGTSLSDNTSNLEVDSDWEVKPNGALNSSKKTGFQIESISSDGIDHAKAVGRSLAADEVSESEGKSESTFAGQVADLIAKELRDEAIQGPATIRIQLNETDLGPINLHVSLANKIVSIRMKTKDQASQQILGRQMSQLRQSLAARGVVCDQCLVELDESSDPSSKSTSATSSDAEFGSGSAIQRYRSRLSHSSLPDTSTRLSFVA